MNKILVIAEHLNGQLASAVAKTITAARAVPGASIDLLVCAASVTVAEQAATLAGVQRVLYAEHARYGHLLSAELAPLVVELAPGYSHIFAASTTFGRDLLPRVAALIGVGQVSDLMEVLDARRFRRPLYAGNAIAEVSVAEPQTVVATIRTASFAATGTQAAAPVNAHQSAATLPTHTRFVELKAGASERPELQAAKYVVSGGRALASAENFKLIYDFADAIGAGVGASRAAVDAGYAPNDMQVGQTGKIIAPDVYFAFGISGAIQHLTGIKDAGTIVAVNKDGEAPIFEVADIGMVGDLFKVIPELKAALQR